MVERGAGSRHPSDLEDEGWVPLCSFPSSSCSLSSAAAAPGHRPAGGESAVELPGLRLGVGKLTLGRSQSGRSAPSSSLGSAF